MPTIEEALAARAKKKKKFKKESLRPYSLNPHLEEKSLKNIKRTEEEQRENSKGTKTPQLENSKGTKTPQLENSKGTKTPQLENSKGTKTPQLENSKGTKTPQLENKGSTEQDSILSKSIEEKRKIKLSNSAIFEVQKLCGIQEKLLILIVKRCVENDGVKTGPITNLEIAERINISIYSAKESIKRLVNKGIIKREEGKKGPGGFSNFSTNDEIISAVVSVFLSEAKK
ncbi:winged helix-turn-helix domain-containing protein [Piscirickettsia salmonis]|uniref:winged helix-turn-helix domain-containing protein n=1 Tax=Piscirickettsia salmonis TaxID=1238 RepID=UPI003EB848BF